MDIKQQNEQRKKRISKLNRLGYKASEILDRLEQKNIYVIRSTGKEESKEKRSVT